MRILLVGGTGATGRPLIRLLAARGHEVVAGEAPRRGASNAKLVRELGWSPAHPSWREGFRTGLA